VILTLARKAWLLAALAVIAVCASAVARGWGIVRFGMTKAVLAGDPAQSGQKSDYDALTNIRPSVMRLFA
jgi:hypothetical protein